MLEIQKIRTSLEGNTFISSIVHLDEVESTNTYAKGKDVTVDTLVLTDFQSKGKGRQERIWLSEKNVNLTFSIKKKLTISPTDNHYSVYYFSYQLFSAINDFFKSEIDENDIEKLEIKWPNDILFDGKKLCGILIESVLPEGIYIIGIGINCNQIIFPTDIKATSLKQVIGKEIDLSDLLIKIINSFSKEFDIILDKEYNKIFSKWKESTKMVGKSCDFEMNDNSINHGNIIDLNEDGSISIENNGKLTKYHSGDIRITGFS